MTEVQTKGADQEFVAPPAPAEMRAPHPDSKEHARRATRRPTSGGPAFGAIVAVTDRLALAPDPAVVRVSRRDEDGNVVVDVTVFARHASEVRTNVRWAGSEKAAQDYLAEDAPKASSDPAVSTPTRYVAFPA